MVVCRQCQHDSSDPQFCDRCNSLLPTGPSTALPRHLTLANGQVLDCSAWNGAWPADFRRPLTVTAQDRPYRLYALAPAEWRRLSAAVSERARTHLDVLAPIEIHPFDEGALVVAEGLRGATHPLLSQRDADDEFAALDALLDACRLLSDCLSPLHEAGLVWLEFDPTALEANESSLALTNLDLALFHAGVCPESIRLSSSYSPPEVCSFRGERIGPATDVFHVSLYLYYRLAGLLPHGFPGKGLEAFDFHIPPLRVYRPHLPAGVAPVLARGLARDTSQRLATVAALYEALETAVTRAKARSRSTTAISWDCAGATVIGRAHEVQNVPNQDSHSIISLGRNAQLAIVADGVTHAQVGSGEIASQAAIEVLGCLLPHYLSESRIEDALTNSFLDASRAILEMALSVAPLGVYNPSDLMSTTAIVGVLAGNELILAGAGDSRAYLIADGRAEQLTVDGDVRCTQLAAGWPPEEVRDLGEEADTLYSCLGVGEVVDPGSPNERLEVSVARCSPRTSRWVLLPGDVIVLCSDGLVEEGVFLEPDELPMLLAEPAHEQSPAEMAGRLVATARSRHRDPSPWEPTGCGDDVTCIVIVIREEWPAESCYDYSEPSP
jgi:serine/threonine protein phosphatase PrpC